MRKKKILYVEDERIFALEMKYIFESLGYEVCASISTGEEAIEMLHENNPDIIVMDIRLGGKLTGIEAAKLIRKASPEIPLVYLSGYGDEQTMKALEKTKPYQFVVKPVDEEVLAAALRAAV